jgi:ribosomal protein L16/L10AE
MADLPPTVARPAVRLSFAQILVRAQRRFTLAHRAIEAARQPAARSLAPAVERRAHPRQVSAVRQDAALA